MNKIEEALAEAVLTNSMAGLAPFVKSPILAQLLRSATMGKPTADDHHVAAGFAADTLRAAGWREDQVREYVKSLYYPNENQDALNSVGARVLSKSRGGSIVDRTKILNALRDENPHRITRHREWLFNRSTSQELESGF